MVQEETSVHSSAVVEDPVQPANSDGKLEGWISQYMHPLLRSPISLDTPLGHTAPSLNGGVYGEIQDGARPVFLAEEDGCRVEIGSRCDLIMLVTGQNSSPKCTNEKLLFLCNS